MGAWTEQQQRDRLADRFIAADPLEITLHRPVFTTSAAGGRTQTSSTVLGGQRFHIYPFKRRLTQEYHYNPQTYGEDKVEFIHYILIFNRDNDIDVNDFFNPANDVTPATDRLQSGLYTVTFISARLWDRGQAGVLFRG